MNILGIDTSSKFLSLAIQKDNRLVFEVSVDSQSRLSDLLIPSIKKALKKGRLSLKTLHGFAVGIGPGSFTGLRVGITMIKALAFSLQKHIVGISSLDIIAQNIGSTPLQICPIVDAKRDNVFSCIYGIKNGNLIKKSKYLLINIRDLLKDIDTKTIFIGDGLKVFGDLIRKEKKTKAIFAAPSLWYPKASSLLTLACKAFRKQKFSDVDKLVPLYLYPKECQIRTKRKII
jgi:tRNA threonylcarbamoyladenosine biosynthesis protein TsaB